MSFINQTFLELQDQGETLNQNNVAQEKKPSNLAIEKLSVLQKLNGESKKSGWLWDSTMSGLMNSES